MDNPTSKTVIKYGKEGAIFYTIAVRAPLFAVVARALMREYRTNKLLSETKETKLEYAKLFHGLVGFLRDLEADKKAGETWDAY